MDAAEELAKILKASGQSYRVMGANIDVGPMTIYGFLHNDREKCLFRTVKQIAAGLGYELVLKPIKGKAK